MKGKKLLAIGSLSIYIMIQVSQNLKQDIKSDKTRNQTKSNLAEKSLLKINSSDETVNGYYNIVLNNTNIKIHNDNLVYKNITKDIWIFYNINKYWVISSSNPDNSMNDNLLYKSLKLESLLPIDCFNNLNISIENKTIYRIIKKIEEEIEDGPDNENDYLEVYSNNIEKEYINNIKDILDTYIALKSSDITKCNITKSVWIRGSANNEINGEYKTYHLKNRYGFIFKKGEFWIAKCILVDKKYLNFTVVWYLAKESPLEGIYFKNKFLYCSNLKDPGNFLKFPAYELLSINNIKSKIKVKLY